jgi:chromosomal replication initiator protein
MMQQVWDKSLQIISDRVGSQVFKTWFKPMALLSIDEKNITLSVPNSFLKEWIIDHYLSLIQETIEGVSDKKPDINIVVTENNMKEQAPIVAVKKNMPVGGLNPNYTFENFVVGPFNQFAHAASLAVADLPAKSYNPLFLYGGVGLGKTHLMHAIAHYVLDKDPGMKINYISSENFINELISSIQHDRMVGFRKKYRSMDVLLVDDIQFFSGKDRTQEEFFHTFNTLYESHKQIVISSDSFPKEIPGLEERLRSRFEWGLIADIKPPDLETKIAILNKKAEKRKIKLPLEVSNLIASKIKSNIRELEGCLTRVSAFSSLTGTEINLALAKEILQDMFSKKEKHISLDMIQKAVAKYYGISILDLKSKKRYRLIAVPRQIAMYLCRSLTGSSLPEIGKSFGGKDHTTVIHSCKKIDALEKEDRKTYHDLENIKALLED